METFSLRLPEELLAELKDEAGEEGTAAYIRQILRDRHESESDLEARVERLEAAVFGPNTDSGTRPDAGPSTARGQSDSDPNTKRTRPDDGPSTPEEREVPPDFDDVVQSELDKTTSERPFVDQPVGHNWSREYAEDLPHDVLDCLGDATLHEDASADVFNTVAPQVASWLREDGGRYTKRQFIEHCKPASDGHDDRVWWERYARPALMALAECGLVNYRSGHHDYHWVGGRE